MRKTTTLLVLVLFAITFNCCTTDDYIPPREDIYFPPITGTAWETTSLEDLDWDATKVDDLYSFLSTNKTRAFLVLEKGKIVMEKYWGQNILNTKDFGKEEFWYWASAGKTITSFLVGMAQQEGRLSIEDKSSKYLGENWTTASIDDENLIRIRHQLSMSTGLDYEVGSLDCTDSLCLKYKKRAGTQWYYHNAPYTLLSKVIENATGMDYNDYTAEKLATTGMKGRWIQSDSSNLFWSTARDAARFGLLMMNEGRWDKTSILKDSDYFGDMIEPSQSINKSYGYLWWLNGKESILYPGFTNSVPTSLAPSAPEDLYAAMGKNGQFIDVVPSDDLVVIRMGEAPDNSLVPIVFHDEMWKKINAIRKK